MDPSDGVGGSTLAFGALEEVCASGTCCGAGGDASGLPHAGGNLGPHAELHRAPQPFDQRRELVVALVEDGLQLRLIGDVAAEPHRENRRALHQLLDDPLVPP